MTDEPVLDVLTIFVGKRIEPHGWTSTNHRHSPQYGTDRCARCGEPGSRHLHHPED